MTMTSKLTGNSSLAQRLMQNPVLAAAYEKVWRPLNSWVWMGFDLGHVRHEKQITVDTLRLQPGDLVVDVACGPGNFTRPFAEAVAPDGLAVGVDYSEAMLERARTNNLHPRAAYLRGDGHHLPFPDASVDAVNCYAALYLIPDPWGVVDEMIRVLKPGGRIAIMTSVASTRPMVRPAQAKVLGLTGLAMFDRYEFLTRLRQAGFTEVEQELHGLAQYVAATAPL
jgi:ubiquinone/menaquinone biosynthesis C-methylase UbiE